MRYAAMLIALLTLSGCAASVMSSSPRTVVVRGGSLAVAEVQGLADTECAKYKRFARLSGKPTPNQFVFDCVE